ncbi:unnamed protein product [Rangifer tarandus platyrhynchus]|uniref:Uncharacterized protein n=1 Tax=Rangifer tarandus platyrhynchus TaxID=3082113 RepID=A0ABN8XJC0_RANTA|nr:unnamed protein product [Rangifer tarandus platyrhynchus]
MKPTGSVPPRESVRDSIDCRRRRKRYRSYTPTTSELTLPESVRGKTNLLLQRFMWAEPSPPADMLKAWSSPRPFALKHNADPETRIHMTEPKTLEPLRGSYYALLALGCPVPTKADRLSPRRSCYATQGVHCGSGRGSRTGNDNAVSCLAGVPYSFGGARRFSPLSDVYVNQLTQVHDTSYRRHEVASVHVREQEPADCYRHPESATTTNVRSCNGRRSSLLSHRPRRLQRLRTE